eukprot:TRINITY_DN8426_c0_g1_i1.p1 TRINITY_DN8426_c0_g1~~TRINITY_DN8426_c0_g1_i1.p1  ORF type:complete len:1110 (+),score=354.23 TRINITY_DN8426_c0_g1_i1:59-3388(+)
MDGGDKPKKAHKKATKGVKGKKKKEKQTGKVEKHNPRAHSFSGGKRSVQKRVQYTLDKQAQKERAPKVDKTPDVPPPFVVVVQGPPGVGKTTVVKSLVRHYCRQRLLEMRGPITLVSGRQRRLTIIECPQDMSAMLDLAKVADLVLCLIDASYGFELETFEFINILQIHGFPRVIGVLTHLDSFRDNKQLRKVKKTLKHRFWSEIYEGAKLFYFSGLQYGRYHRLEVQNLARFIAVQKNSILSWRQAHPYVLGLRWEDQTDPSLPETAPRRLDIYGYVYGSRLREGTEAHLAGIGDFHIAALKELPDPCPPPMDVEAEHRKATGKDKDGQQKKKNALRSLAERHRAVYAPGSDIGSITVDADTMYINVPEHQDGFTRREDEVDPEDKEDGDEDDEEEGQAASRNLPEAVRMVRALQSGEGKMARAADAKKQEQFRLLGNAVARLPAPDAGAQRERRPAPAGGRPGMATAESDDGEDEGREADDESSGGEDVGEDSEDAGEEGCEEEEDAGDEDAGEAEEEEGEGVAARARARFDRAPRLEEVIYGRGGSRSSTAGSKSAKNGKAKKGADGEVVADDSGRRGPTDHASLPLFDDDSEEGAEEDAKGEKAASGSKSGSRRKGLLGNLGDIDGLDTARMPELPGEQKDGWDEARKEALKSRKFITGGWSSAEEDEGGDGKKKKAEKATGDGNEEGEENAEGESVDPKAKAALAQLEGLGDGAAIARFVRIRLEDVPAACVAQLRRDRILLLGGLLAGESRLGLVQVRVKRHRWHPKLLKSGDAMLMSVGWRRFQTVPTFSLEDRGEKRMRFLKYTLEHAHCTMTYYGPAVPPNTGVLAFRSFEKVGHFRICATGGVLETAPNFNIMKKLKLVGEPYKIFRNTAFIKGMFTSDLEVNKYSHTKIQTVSGIRGEIKKAEGTKGQFRATFEDRILLSDLVVCKCWIGVRPKEFYHPVLDVSEWRRAKLIGELRAEQGVAVPSNADSQYGKQLVRAERKFNPLRIPKALEAALPFKTRPKNDQKKQGKFVALRKKTAVVSSERDHQINSLMLRLHTIRKEKKRIREQASTKKKEIREKRDKFIQDKRDAHSAESRKKRYIKQGNAEKRQRQAMKMD